MAITRRYTHWSDSAVHSRSRPNRGVKLFGVRLSDGSIRKSATILALTTKKAPLGGSPPDLPAAIIPLIKPPPPPDGYASEDFVAGSSSSRERRKGVPWTEDEHRMFLLGLQKLGKSIGLHTTFE